MGLVLRSILAVLLLSGVAVAAAKKELPQRVPARQELQPKGLEGVGLTAEQVNTAIDKGAKFLWEYLKTKEITGHAPFGDKKEHVLCALALVHAGAHKKYPDCDAAIRQLLAGWKVRTETYEDGLAAMLIEAYGDPSFEPQLREQTKYLINAQGQGGTWNYGVNINKIKPPAGGAGLRALSVSGGVPLDGDKPAVDPLPRTAPFSKDHDGDHSTSQYAVLGLHSATRAGLGIPADTWQRALAAHRKNQQKDGGWAYHGGGSSYGSMTCAGICAVTIARHQLGEKEPAVDESIEKGLGWLAANFSVSKHPESHEWHYYYLYGLERVGRILDTEFIGPHEWYPLGAKFLVGAQKANGSWKAEAHESDERLATSFALLFLTRATPSLNVQPKRGGDGILRTAVIAKPSRIYFILDASGSMLDERDGKPKFDLAREAVLGILKEVPDEAEVALRVYGHRKRAIEDDADQDTELVFPLAKLDRVKMERKLWFLRARGKTPLALSLRETAKDLAGTANPQHPVTVVLLTDGGEDTLPRQDPVKSAAELAKLKGIDLHVVGFDVAEREDWTRQLEAISAKAGGRYWPAAKADALQQQLRCAVLKTPEKFEVVDKDGKPTAAGAFGQSVKLHEGKYTLTSNYADKTFTAEFWINTESTTSVTFDAEAAYREAAAAATQKSPTANTVSNPDAGPKDPPAAKKFCGQCGKPLAPGAKFCTECGAKSE